MLGTTTLLPQETFGNIMSTAIVTPEDNEPPNPLGVFVMQLVVDKLMQLIDGDVVVIEALKEEAPLPEAPIKNTVHNQFDYDL